MVFEFGIGCRQAVGSILAEAGRSFQGLGIGGQGWLTLGGVHDQTVHMTKQNPQAFEAAYASCFKGAAEINRPQMSEAVFLPTWALMKIDQLPLPTCNYYSKDDSSVLPVVIL